MVGAYLYYSLFVMLGTCIALVWVKVNFEIELHYNDSARTKKRLYYTKRLLFWFTSATVVLALVNIRYGVYGCLMCGVGG